MAIFFELIKKDFSLMKNQLFAYGALAIASLAIMAIPTEVSGFLGSLSLAFTMVAFYCTLVMKVVINEHKNKNHLFLMTLPLSSRQLLMIKLANVLLLFFSFWTPIFMLVVLFLINSPHWPGAALAFYTAGFAMYLPAFLLILAAALLTFSEAVTILAFVASNMAVAIFLNYLPKAGFMQKAFEQGSLLDVGVLWPDQINALVMVEGGLFVALLALCLFATSRNRTLLN